MDVCLWLQLHSKCRTKALMQRQAYLQFIGENIMKPHHRCDISLLFLIDTLHVIINILCLVRSVFLIVQIFIDPGQCVREMFGLSWLHWDTAVMLLVRRCWKYPNALFKCEFLLLLLNLNEWGCKWYWGQKRTDWKMYKGDVLVERQTDDEAPAPSHWSEEWV